MFRLKYTIAEVARMLRVTKAALKTDIEAGRLRVRSGAVPRSSGLRPGGVVQVFVADLKRYLGGARTKEVFGKPGEEKEEGYSPKLPS